MAKSSKELIEEFIASGGKVTVIPPTQREPEVTVTTSSANAGPAVILTYSDADLFYGEVRKRKSTKPLKAKQEVKINFDALPEALKNRYKELMK